MAELQAPLLIKPIPNQIINEGGAFRPLDLKEFIQSPNVESGIVRFRAEISDGSPLPKGLICTESGLISGIPASGTQGEYTFIVSAFNDSDTPLSTQFNFSIKPRIAVESDQFLTQLKSQIWDAIGHNLPLPAMEDFFNRPVTAAEIYYLLQRFATLTIWDVYNLEYPGEKTIIQLEGASPHYEVYDRGSCIVAAPKDLFSYERTLEDALKTARAMAREVYNRGWVIEFAGFDKMVRAAWIEVQLMGEKFGKALEVLHFSPTLNDIKIYNEKIRTLEI